MRIELLLLALAACAGADDDAKGDPAADPCATDAIALTDANNYAFTGALDVPTYTTASGTDLDICWDAVTTDIQCHALDPAADVDVAGLVRFGSLSQEDVERGLSTNDLQQGDMSGYVQFENDAGATCASLSAMSFFGTSIDVAAEYVEGGGTYMLLLTTGTTPGVGARMIAFLEPSAGSTETTVAVSPGCGVLDFSVDLHSRAAAPACASGEAWEVDWSAVTVDGQGNAFDPTQIDRLLLGFYEGRTITDIEADFLDLEQSATRLWSMPLTGDTRADLAQASDGAAAFSGFAGDGTWVLALQCSRCYNPAPLVVTVLEPANP